MLVRPSTLPTYLFNHPHVSFLHHEEMLAYETDNTITITTNDRRLTFRPSQVAHARNATAARHRFK